MRNAWLAMSGLLCLALAVEARADSARAWLDRDTMRLGETITLNVEVEGTVSGEPDFSPLGVDFNTLGTQSSRQFSMSNGQAASKMVWAIGLEPKRAGTFVIPALAIGPLATSPLQLTVLPAPVGADGKAGDDVYIEVSAEPTTPYVQQQVRFLVKLHYAVELTEGALEEPAADGVVVQKLGRDRSYSAMVGTRRYNVLERRYALIPERSGTLTLPVIAFRGSAPDRSDPTGFFRRGRALTARSDAIELEVRAKPAEWGSAPWLPAASLAISEESVLPDEVAVGEPVTRTLRIRAQGLAYEQLPELAFEAPPGSEIYPDKPDTQTRDDGTWLFGERTRKFAIVASRPGTLVLPAVQVEWWDTVADRRATAVLPAREIRVVAATGAAATPASSGDGVPAAAAPTVVTYPSGGADPDSRLWRTLALGMSVLWLATAFFWWRERRSAPVPRKVPAPPAHPGRAAFLRASATGDLAEAERAVLGWARSERPDLRNLGEVIAALGDPDQRAALLDLQRVRYAGAGIDGLGARLERGFRRGFGWADGAPEVADASPLPPLYPGRD